MKKGFTLVEMLVILVLIGFLYVIIFPFALEYLRRGSEQIDQRTEDLIFAQTKLYIRDNPHEFPIIKESVYCIELNTLVFKDYLGDYLPDGTKRQKLNYHKIVKVEVNDDVIYSLVHQCNENVSQIVYVDQSGANPPKLYGQMFPVIWNDGWVTADPSEPWYDYQAKEWANVVLLRPQVRNMYWETGANVMIDDNDILAHFVWIPRYRYKLFNATSGTISNRVIEIEFEGIKTEKSNSAQNGGWLTHPAFTLRNQELSGFWVGKFSTTGDVAIPTIKGNHEMLLNLSMLEQFDVAKTIGTEDYGLIQETKMLRNTEWGAVAYLAHSIYGKNSEIWLNPNEDFITGCAYLTANHGVTAECEEYYTDNGVKSSTTGNVYGVYDMAGGSWERVLAGMLDNNGAIIAGNSGFGTLLEQAAMHKLIDLYFYSEEDNTYQRRILGDATGETHLWYGNQATMLHLEDAWVIRGGNNLLESASGIFAFSADDGGIGVRSFRVAIPAY